MLLSVPFHDFAQAAQNIGVVLSLFGITLGCITAAKGGHQ